MISINYINQYNDDRHYKSIITKALKKGYKVLGLREKTIISVVLVDDSTIHELNRTYRGKDQPTDVLSFENTDDLYEIGDVFISVDTVKKQAETLGHDMDYEMIYLAVHGFLHCLGYDHIEDDDAEVMDQLQKRIMKQTKYKRSL